MHREVCAVPLLALGRSDAGLLRAYVRGNYAAFETLYTRHKEALFNFVFRSLGHYAVAEELAQDVWMTVLDKAGQYESRGATFKTWLFTIARNKVIDFQRRRTNQSHTDVDDLVLQDQDIDHEQQILLQQLLNAMDRLPDEQRETFILQQEGFSNREISDITGVGSETVKSRLRYARTALRQQFGGEV